MLRVAVALVVLLGGEENPTGLAPGPVVRELMHAVAVLNLFRISLEAYTPTSLEKVSDPLRRGQSGLRLSSQEGGRGMSREEGPVAE